MIKELLSTKLGQLRIMAFFEGISFLVLLGIAMPLKYMMDQPQAVRVVGMAHGVLFIGYCWLLFIVATEYKWSLRKSLLAFVASLVPFGTFWADVKLFRE
jgi:integral membrane protein